MTLRKLTGRLGAGAVAIAVVLSVGLMATPAAASDDYLKFTDCQTEAPGELTDLKPTGPRTLTVSGRLDLCGPDYPLLRLGLAAYSVEERKTVALPKFGPAPTFGFTQQDIRLPVGKVRLCLLRTPYGAEDCYALLVETDRPPVVVEHLDTRDTALRARPNPDGFPFPFCATCW